MGGFCLSAIPPPPNLTGPEQREPSPSTVSSSGLGGGEGSPPSPCCGGGGGFWTNLSTGFRDLEGVRVPPRVEPPGPCPPLSQGSTWALGHQAPSSAWPNSGPCLGALPLRGWSSCSTSHPRVGGGLFSWTPRALLWARAVGDPVGGLGGAACPGAGTWGLRRHLLRLGLMHEGPCRRRVCVPLVSRVYRPEQCHVPRVWRRQASCSAQGRARAVAGGGAPGSPTVFQGHPGSGVHQLQCGPE